MSFINVNKITLDETEDVNKAMCDVVLLLSSLIYDDVEKKNYDKALGQIEGLKHSVISLEYVLKNNNSKPNE